MSFYDELMQDFRKMLNFRNSVGYATATYISSVTPFIEYCGTHYPEADCLRWLTLSRHFFGLV